MHRLRDEGDDVIAGIQSEFDGRVVRKSGTPVTVGNAYDVTP